MEEKDITERPILKQEKDGSLVPTKQLAATMRISVPDTTSTFEESYETDDVAKTLRSQQPGQQLLKYKGKLYLPKQEIEKVIRDHHDDPLQGHPGVAKTMELLGRTYAAPRLRTHVEQYIKECVLCQQNKSSRHAKYGQIKFATIPESPWKDVTMDFVVKLPMSKDPVSNDEYDSIMVIVDKLTKYAIMIPFKETYKANQLGFILLDRLIRDHGIPESITSDRDRLFTSSYWRTLVSAIGTKLKMSTAYHPETDGQTERTNQTMETFLRHYVNKRQNDWVSLLPITQLAYNDKQSDTTKVSPFFANYGRNANLFLDPRKGPDAEKALVLTAEMKALHQGMQQEIGKANDKVAARINKKRKMYPQLKKGDKVYLLTKNMTSKRPSRKLDHVKVGPFLIKEPKGPVNYELQLPADAKVHPVFHVSLLEPADSKTPLQETFYFEIEEEDEFEAEEILAQDGQKYLIKWKGCDETENTWEPLEHLTNCRSLLRQFRQGQSPRNPSRSHPAKPASRNPRPARSR